MESRIEMLIEFLRNSSSILVTILGGIVFSKLVYRNMMRRSQEETTESPFYDEGVKSGSNTKTKITINELTNRDIILPVSGDSFDYYLKIFKVIKLRFVLVAGCIVFPVIFLITIPVENKYFLIASCGLFIIFIIGLISVYFKNIYGIKKISKTLVVLRVFGSRTNTQFLFNQIASLWNYLGTTFTIMDPVYARSEFRIFNTPKNLKIKIAQLSSFIPGTVFVGFHSFHNEFLDFMFVLFSTIVVFMIFLLIIADSLFIKDAKALFKKIHKNSNFTKRYNGMGRQVNLYCFDNIWKQALREILGRADLTVMDLRGFSSERKGCAFEISYLINNFDLDKILFIINKNTDRSLVIDTIQQESDKISGNSPNAGKDNLNVSVYSCEKQNIKDTQQILRILCNKLSGSIETSPVAGELSFTTGIPVVKIPDLLIFIFASIVFTITIIFSSSGVSYILQSRTYENAQDIIAAPPPEPLAIYKLPTFSKTTADMEPHFVKMTILLGYETDPMLNTELVNRKDEILHIVNIILSGKTYEELNSVSGAVTLAEEIKAHINMRLVGGKIKEVYFEEFVVN